MLQSRAVVTATRNREFGLAFASHLFEIRTVSSRFLAIKLKNLAGWVPIHLELNHGLAHRPRRERAAGVGVTCDQRVKVYDSLGQKLPHELAIVLDLASRDVRSRASFTSAAGLRLPLDGPAFEDEAIPQTQSTFKPSTRAKP